MGLWWWLRRRSSRAECFGRIFDDLVCAGYLPAAEAAGGIVLVVNVLAEFKFAAAKIVSTEGTTIGRIQVDGYSLSAVDDEDVVVFVFAAVNANRCRRGIEVRLKHEPSVDPRRQAIQKRIALSV